MSVLLENVGLDSLHVVLSHHRLRSKSYYISLENEAIEFLRKSDFRAVDEFHPLRDDAVKDRALATDGKSRHVSEKGA